MQLKKKEMEFETLKKSHKKQIILGALAVVLVGSAITFVTTRAKYKLTQDINIASGTVNYKPYDFKVIAMYKSEDGSNYTEITEMPESGYIVNEEKSYCTTDNKTQVKGKIKTVDGNIAISNLNKSDKCYVWFDKELSASDIILANVSKGSGLPNFSKTSCTSGCEEATVGTYTIEDGMYGGRSTYWRGDTMDNYVKFGGFCWRIIRINGDGSIRLIYDGSTCHANGTSTSNSIAKTGIAYNTKSNLSSYVGWTYTSSNQRPSSTSRGTESNAKIQLESWYLTSLASYADKIADGKFCNDRSVANGYTWAVNGSTFYYAGRTRLYIDYVPTLSCASNDTYILKVGLVTADEVEFAGGKNANNTSYYLYNGQTYWTISPSWWNGGGQAIMFVVRGSDNSLSHTDATGNLGLRPVINLRSDITISGGNGTQSNPYVVS